MGVAELEAVMTMKLDTSSATGVLMYTTISGTTPTADDGQARALLGEIMVASDRWNDHSGSDYMMRRNDEFKLDSTGLITAPGIDFITGAGARSANNAGTQVAVTFLNESVYSYGCAGRIDRDATFGKTFLGDISGSNQINFDSQGVGNGYKVGIRHNGTVYDTGVVIDEYTEFFVGVYYDGTDLHAWVDDVTVIYTFPAVGDLPTLVPTIQFWAPNTMMLNSSWHANADSANGIDDVRAQLNVYAARYGMPVYYAPVSGASLGLTMLGGASDIALTSAGWKLGLLSPRFLIVVSDADGNNISLPVGVGNTEGPERFIIYNAGAKAFTVGTLPRIEVGQTIAVGVDGFGVWLESWRRNKGDDMARLTQTITLTDLQSIGALIAGGFDLPDLPAGARVLAMTIRAIQASALTSGAGTVTGMQARLRSAIGGGGDLTILVNGLHSATQSHAQRAVGVNDTGASSLPLASVDPEAYTIHFDVSGSGVNFANLDGPVGDIYEVELIYAT